MGFTSKSLYNICDFNIDIESIISPVFNLIIELSTLKGNDEDFHLWGSKIFDVSKIYGRDTLPDEEDASSLLNKISNSLTEKLYENSGSLKGNKILCLHNKRKLLIVHQSAVDKIKNILSQWVMSFSPVDKFFDFVKDEKLKGLNNKISSLIHFASYSQRISIRGSKLWNSCIIPSIWLNQNELKYQILDNAALWISPSLIPEVESIENLDVYELYYPDGFVGIKIKDYVLPIVNIDDRIIPSYFSDYFHLMLREVYSPDKAGRVSRSELEHFRNISKESEFCKLLSYLCYNLYIVEEGTSIPPKYQIFFDSVVGLENIEKFENYQLYLSKPNYEKKSQPKTIIGIYEKEKKDEEYNLLNWLTCETDIINSHTSNKMQKQDYKHVSALRPPYSYYFISKYYEDIFADLLAELHCCFNTNVKLWRDSDNEEFIEIDAIVRSSNGTFLYFENKTTLNRYNIENTIQKIEAFHVYVCEKYPNVKFEYFIVAPYCNESLEEGFRYFIYKDGSKHEKREGVRFPIYNFEVPIAKFENVVLHCIVEPEYDKMKAIISELIK